MLRALGWEPRQRLEEVIAATVTWYRDHPEWWQPLRDRAFDEYYQRQYGARLAGRIE